MIIASKVGNDLINTLEHNTQFKKYVSYSTYVRECRTIGAILPRQSGKTTFLTSLHRKESSVLFVKSIVSVGEFKHLLSLSSVIPFASIEGFSNRFRGMHINGLKYSCFILDEFEFMTKNQSNDFYELIDMLHSVNMLHEDFYVIKMST